jgi:hypothetical protein
MRVKAPVVDVTGSILPHGDGDVNDERSMWLGAGIAVVAGLALTAIGAASESSINGPGERVVAAPVLWAFGGGAGLVLGAVVAAWLSRRAWPGVFAAVVGALPFLVLVVVAYNSSDLRAEDQIVGSLVVVVLPGLLVAMLAAWATAALARMTAGRRHAEPASS